MIQTQQQQPREATAAADKPQTAPAPAARGRPARRALATLRSGSLVAVALVVGLYGVSSGGPLMPDSPRYANGACMMRDWMLSGNYLHPVAFAQENYAQYPGFNIPFHPPGYPGLLGTLYLITGVSYFWGRAFIAACLALSGCFAFAVSRRLGVGAAGAWAGALLLITLPEIACWSRDMMSEVPALMFLLAGSLAFLTWVRTRRPVYVWLAFGLAEFAFFSRVTSAGVLPAWFLFLAVSGRKRRLVSAHLIAAAVLFLAVNVAWVKFALSYSELERPYRAANVAWQVGRFSWANMAYYPAHLPEMVGWGTLAAAAVGAAFAARSGRYSRAGLFWLAWLASYFAFQWALAVHEPRYFLFALPALPGLAACLFRRRNPAAGRRWLAPGLTAAALAVNVVLICRLPGGLVGYDAVAADLARQDKPGNVLMACWEDQELIFRYRACAPPAQRMLYRSDRTLAIRAAKYTGLAPEVRAHTVDDLLDVIRRGRIRYVVTCASEGDRWRGHTDEMDLADRAVRTCPDRFALVGRFPLRIEYQDSARPLDGEVILWEYTGELPEGKSELPVIIPTANLRY
jgi:4-amino-4-deoxy-L-arabinose transferase-like glycosyltransferase